MAIWGMLDILTRSLLRSRPRDAGCDARGSEAQGDPLGQCQGEMRKQPKTVSRSQDCLDAEAPRRFFHAEVGG